MWKRYNTILDFSFASDFSNNKHIQYNSTTNILHIWHMHCLETLFYNNSWGVFDGAEDIDLERVRPNFCYASIFQVENLLKYKIIIFYSSSNSYYLSTTYNNQVTIILLNISVCLVH